MSIWAQASGLSYHLYAALKCPVGIAALLWLSDVPLSLFKITLSALKTAHTWMCH